MTLAIRTRTTADGVVVGEVTEGDRVLAECFGWKIETPLDALKAANAKRAEIQAERERRDALIEARWQRGPAWQGSYLACPCGNEVFGADPDGLWRCDGFIHPEKHAWRKTGEGWERVSD